uniref:PQ-loop repeat-containing protein 2 n=1 Tax=Laticauda laticaudata TaxID=8630 RepID=A0A8C5RFD6_LATLA
MALQLHPPALNISPVEAKKLCLNGTPWIWHLLEECVRNAWEYWSILLGLISIACFLFAALPQLYVAYQNGKVEQALSLSFLLCWLAGDLTNFIGCYLTDQLPIQVNFAGVLVLYLTMAIIYKYVLLDVLFLESSLKEKKTRISFVCGYLSCVFYLGSRIPQLHKNFQRRSTDGTSYLLFALAMIGNGTYGLSLVLKMPATQYLISLYFWHHLPWFIGSFGVLLLDIFSLFFDFAKTNQPFNGRSLLKYHIPPSSRLFWKLLIYKL